ncbi:MAG: hypothetical protein EZS28_013231 [Streblomastix strix]|uniref:Uncharacterized protein n=1 Tax=Streblomastix strix TaxID=222440 RepID=A0A5J4W9Q1_9EUKA|nr:MAG: hypothetical protein EZS28_013231 [Streblomastix strix]
MLGTQAIVRCETANKDAIGITNLLFEIPQLSYGRVKTKKFSQLTPSSIWKQTRRQNLSQNGIQAIEQNQETQIIITYKDFPPPNSGPRELPPQGQGPTGPQKHQETQRDHRQRFSFLY